MKMISEFIGTLSSRHESSYVRWIIFLVWCGPTGAFQIERIPVSFSFLTIFLEPVQTCWQTTRCLVQAIFRYNKKMRDLLSFTFEENFSRKNSPQLRRQNEYIIHANRVSYASLTYHLSTRLKNDITYYFLFPIHTNINLPLSIGAKITPY